MDLAKDIVKNVYEQAMAIEFREHNINYEIEKYVEIMYKEQRCGSSELDFVIHHNDTSIVVELKSVGSITKNHQSQLKGYMRALDCDIGMIILFPVGRELDIDRDFVIIQ